MDLRDNFCGQFQGSLDHHTFSLHMGPKFVWFLVILGVKYTLVTKKILIKWVGVVFSHFSFILSDTCFKHYVIVT